MRREAPVRVEAPSFRDGVDARQPEPGHGLRLARQCLAFQPDERRAALELRTQRAHRHVQRASEGRDPPVGRRALGPQLARPHVDRWHVDRERKRLARAIDDGSAMGQELDALMVLHGGEASKRRSPQHGQIERTRRDQGEERRKQACDGDHAPPPPRPHGSTTTCPFSGSLMPRRRRAMSAMRAGSRSVAISTWSSWRSCSSRSCIWRADDSS